MIVNLILQGKGGVGKSVVASFLTQHYRSRGINPVCIDTDPVNSTFAGYKAFGVQRLDIMDGPDINQRRFDDLMESIMTSDDPEAVMVVDNGAASFVPLGSYLASNEVFPLLSEAGHQVRLHTVLTGGQALDDTFHGLMALAQNFPEAPLVVWMNHFFGPLERNGVEVEKSSQYKALGTRVMAQVTLPQVKMETFGADLKEMLSLRLTFDEALTAEDKNGEPLFKVMTRQRLKTMQRTIFAQMDRVLP